MNDLRCQEQQSSALSAGRYISVSAGSPDRICGWWDVDVHYSLSCRPISLNFLSDWKLVEPEYAEA
jgi:hypothetical protein